MTDKKPEDLEGAMADHRRDVLKKHDSYSIVDIPTCQKLMAEIPQGFMDVFGRLTPEEVQRIKDYYKGRQFYVSSIPFMKALGRATYVGPSVSDVSEDEKTQIIKDFISKYSGVPKE